MSNQHNPFGGASQYAVTTRFGDSTQGNGARPESAGEAVLNGDADLVKDTTTAGFSADVIQESRRQTVLVDFWAPWCGPCRQLTPVLEKAVREARGAVKLVKMNIDDHPSIAGQLGIQSIPAVIAFRDGRPVDGFMGALPESQIREFIKRVGGADGAAAQIEDAMAAAAEARQQGDLQGAAQIYAAVLAEAPDSVDAIGSLADILLENGDIEQAEAILDRAPAEKKDAAPIASVRTKIALAREVASLGDPQELNRRIEADPNDHQARFDLALIQNARGMREEAADNLLKIMKADRSWKDDAARNQLLRFFEAWGMSDPTTLAARRKLSSMLFS